jgi:Uma2 family endonuclease
MNFHLYQGQDVTRAADGFDRRAFTVDEVLLMQEVGIIDPDERFELLEGDIVLMQANNYVHERIKLALVRMLSRTLPDTMQLGVETSAYLSEITFVNPDLSIFPMMDTQKVRGADILLAIEVSNTSLRKDLNLKAGIYAKYGVRELWVIDARKCVTHVFRAPVDNVWTHRETLASDALLRHETAPGFALRLSDL